MSELISLIINNLPTVWQAYSHIKTCQKLGHAQNAYTKFAVIQNNIKDIAKFFRML